METKKCQNPTPKFLGYKEYRSKSDISGPPKTRFPGTQKPEKWHFGPQKPEKPTFWPFWDRGSPKTEFIESQYCKKGTPKNRKSHFRGFWTSKSTFLDPFWHFSWTPTHEWQKATPPKTQKHPPPSKPGFWGVQIWGGTKPGPGKSILYSWRLSSVVPGKKTICKILYMLFVYLFNHCYLIFYIYRTTVVTRTRYEGENDFNGN